MKRLTARQPAPMRAVLLLLSGTLLGMVAATILHSPAFLHPSVSVNTCEDCFASGSLHARDARSLQ